MSSSLRWSALAAAALLTGLVACDKPASPGAAASASASATAAAPSASPSASASAAPSAAASASAVPSAAPDSSSSTSQLTGDAKDVVLTVRAPDKEPEKTVKVTSGGTITLFLPDAAGEVWTYEGGDKTLGKPKEQVIPGFAPGVSGHEFKWTLAAPMFKSGAKHKATFVAKKGAKRGATFALTLDVL